MEFPPDWNMSEATEFDTAFPSSPGAVSVELLAQLRNTGHILDGSGSPSTAPPPVGDQRGPLPAGPGRRVPHPTLLPAVLAP
jgi:hypothetical protein